MPGSTPLTSSRAVGWAAVGVGLAVLFYFMPLFHVVSLKGAQEEAAAAVVDAGDCVETFWRGPRRDASSRAVDAAELLSAFRRDFAGTADSYGHRLGLSGHSSYLVSGMGTIVSVDEHSVSIALQEDGPVEVVIEIGPVFGNAIRDGSGLLDVSDFENAQDFNALSAEINRRVEERVLPVLQANAAAGTSVRFVGGVEVRNSGDAPASLKLVPVAIEFP